MEPRVEKITPAKATTYLDRNRSNRKLRDGVAEKYADDMRNYLMSKGTVTASAGLWRDTFMKAMNSIKYFMAGKSLMVIKSVAEEAYPWPIPKAKRK